MFANLVEFKRSVRRPDMRTCRRRLLIMDFERTPPTAA